MCAGGFRPVISSVFTWSPWRPSKALLPDCLANSHPNGQGSTVLAEESPARFNILRRGSWQEEEGGRIAGQERRENRKKHL